MRGSKPVESQGVLNPEANDDGRAREASEREREVKFYQKGIAKNLV
jgi:hypothetical protein